MKKVNAITIMGLAVSVLLLIGVGMAGASSVFQGATATAVPEPASMFLLGSGLIGLAGFGRRKLRKA